MQVQVNQKEISDSVDNSSRQNALLEARNLSKRYEDGVLALDDISFSVNSGQIYAMLGGNGAGKTTTINIFLNYIEPTSGQAFINGIDAVKEPLSAKENIAFVSENVMLYDNFSAIQNLNFFAKLAAKTDYKETDYRDVLLRVGLQEEAHHNKLRTFSKGMRQKSGIAIAILKDAPVIILDEPTAGLDPKAGFEFMRLLESLREEGKAIFMSTHDIFRARETADTIGILNKGKLVMQRNRNELSGENLEKLYVEHMAGYMEANNN